MTRLQMLLCSTCLALAQSMRAKEIYVVRVEASSALNAGSCTRVNWRDNIVFFNSGSTLATIRLLEVSNGGILHPPALSLQVPAGGSINSAGKTNWSPSSQDPIWINRIDVPDGVAVRSRVEAASASCLGGPPSLVPNFGAFSLPVIDQLIPPGSPQIHLGADLGAQASTLNVGIYNDGGGTATARVEVREVCDDTLRESSTFAIPPKTVLQFGGLGSTGTLCPGVGSEFNSWMRYVIVTMDQPGFSYIVNRSTAIPNPPLIPYASP